MCVLWKHAVSVCMVRNSRVCSQHSLPWLPPVSLPHLTQRSSELMSQLAKLRLRGASSDGGHVQEDWAASMDSGHLKWFLVWQIESAGYEISKGRKHSQHIADQWKSWCHAVGQCIEMTPSVMGSSRLSLKKRGAVDQNLITSSKNTGAIVRLLSACGCTGLAHTEGSLPRTEPVPPSGCSSPQSCLRQTANTS